MHAAARIEQQRHVNRRLVVCAEIDDRAGMATFKDLKVARPEIPYDAIARIAHKRRNRDERDPRLEYRLSVQRVNRQWRLQSDTDCDDANKSCELSRLKCSHQYAQSTLLDFDERGRNAIDALLGEPTKVMIAASSATEIRRARVGRPRNPVGPVTGFRDASLPRNAAGAMCL